MPIILAGLKSDLRDLSKWNETDKHGGIRPTTYAEGLATAKSIGAAAYVECSAWDQLGIRELYHTVAGVGAHYKRVRPRRKRLSSCVLM